MQVQHRIKNMHQASTCSPECQKDDMSTSITTLYTHVTVDGQIGASIARVGGRCFASQPPCSYSHRSWRLVDMRPGCIPGPPVTGSVKPPNFEALLVSMGNAWPPLFWCCCPPQRPNLCNCDRGGCEEQVWQNCRRRQHQRRVSPWAEENHEIFPGNGAMYALIVSDTAG